MRDLAALIGISAVLYGLVQLYEPLAWMAGGAVILFVWYRWVNHGAT